jgi:hypothetical protein
MFNILRNADIRNDTSCRHDNNVGWSVEWSENEDFKGYTTASGVTTRLVWDRNYVFATTSGICSIAPSTDQTPFDASEYSQVRINYRIENSDTTVIVPTTAKIQFQTVSDPTYDTDKQVEFPVTVDNSYNEYTIDMSEIRLWTGNINRIRFFPFIDGAEGYIVHVKSIEALSISNFACDTIHKTNLCDKYSQFSHPCPWVGAGGSCQSDTIPSGITIVEGVNDKLVVNINDYGNHAVTLTPVASARPEDVARDLENKLSNTAIAGYSGNKVTVENRKINIIADDTRETNSTVSVLDTAAARTLGFYTAEGVESYLEIGGEDAASEYTAAGTVPLSKSQLAGFYGEDQLSAPGISMDVSKYSLTGGRSDYELGYSDKKIDFTDKTLIDFNNPISNTGKLVSVAYSGDGNPTTEFRIFRPKADGTITHIHSVDMEISLATEDAVFESIVNLKVRKGDFLGLYNGMIARGKTQDVPNGSYILYEGDLKDGESIQGPQVVSARGDAGLRLFARGEDKQSSAVIDIEFEQLEMVENITVIAEEEERVEEINLSKAKVGGLNGGVYITGTTGLDKFGAQAPPLTNLAALTDGVKRVSPDYTDTYPSWLDGTVSPADLYDQTDFSIAMDFAKGVNVFFDINKVSMHFTNTFNIKYFSIEYPLTTNADDTQQFWGPVLNKYSTVSIEGKLIEPDDHPLYYNPTHPTVDNYLESYQSLNYRALEFTFPSVKAKSIRYNVYNANFEDENFKETLSNFVLAPSPRIMEMEVFAESRPTPSISDNFSFQSSQDGSNFVLHTNVDVTGIASANYLIGYPVKNIRATFKPQGRMSISSITASVSIGNTSVSSGALDGTVSLNSAIDDFTNYETITATNNSTGTNNYYVNISSQRGTVDRCILWNKLSNRETSDLSEIGPSPTISRREDFYYREYNYSYNVPSYMLDPNWLINVNAVSYVSYDTAASWEFIGNTITDYNSSTSITSISPQVGSHPLVYVIVDLGQLYDIETIQHFNSEDNIAFTGPAFCSLDIDNPDDLDIVADFEGSQQSARWLRYSSFANLTGDDNIKDITYVDLSLDASSRRNISKLPWVSALRLTNYSTANRDPNENGEGWSFRQTGFTQWYMLDLEDHRNITNIILGPQTDNFFVGDYDTLEPGGFASAYSTSSKANANIAYSSSNVTDPSRVRWGNLGDEPGPTERWLLLRAPDDVRDEVIVHVDDNIQENKTAFASASWWTSVLGTVYKDEEQTIEGKHSISIDYPASSGPVLETIELRQSLGIDHNLASRDNLRILLFISDINQLDLSQGSIQLGRDDDETQEGTSPWAGVEKDLENYFEWPMSSISSLLDTGWNEIYLPFSGNFQIGEPYIATDNYSRINESSLSGKSRVKWLSLSFAGVEDNDKVEVKVQGIKVVRAEYTSAKYGNALYLTGNEYAKFPLDNFNTLEGTIEFFINPEWSKDPLCNSCEDPRDHTIFRVFNNDGFVLALFMTGRGLRVYLTNGDKHYFLTDGSNNPIVLGENTHVAVTWDLLGSKGAHAVKIYINGVISTTMDREVILEPFSPNSSAVFMLGGLAWDGVMSNISSSVDGSIENLKVFNYSKSDFSYSLVNQGLQHVRPSEELIEISVDGVNFYGSGTRGINLPLLVGEVSPGESFDVYVRNRDNSTATQATDKNRTSFVEIVRSSS